MLLIKGFFLRSISARGISAGKRLIVNYTIKDYLLCPMQAFGVPDPKVGEEICVFLRLREGVTLTEQEVRDYCKDKVSSP